MNKKFTLIELVTVIVVIAIIAAIILLNISKVKDRALDSAKVANLSEMQKIVDMYYLERDMYPTNVQPKLGPEKVEQSMLVTEFQKKKIKHEFCVEPTGEVIFFEDCETVNLDDLPVAVEVLTCEKALQVGYEKCIHNQEELKSIEEGLYSRYIIVNDFNIAGEWEPIVLSDVDSYIELNGNGYSIGDLSINTIKDKSGMFAESNNITIKNLKLMDSKLKVNEHSYSGLLIGYTNGSVILDNIAIFSEIEGSGNYVGGLIGASDNTESIPISSKTTNVVGRIKINLMSGDNVGGLFGLNIGNVENVNVEVDIKGAGYNYGGVIGEQGDYSDMTSILSNIYSTGMINNEGSRTGLVFGSLYFGEGHTNISAKGKIIGERMTGGIMGLGYSKLMDISFEGEVSGTEIVGGISGEGDFEGINDNPLNIKVKGSIYGTGSQIGGVSGVLINNANEGFTVDTVVVGEGSNVGGLFGMLGADVSNISGKVIVTGNSGIVGGVVGRNRGQLNDVKIKGEVYGLNSNIGGIAGESTEQITNVHYEGLVKSLNSAQSTETGLGGIIGYSNSAIDNSSFKGTISANETGVGGITGYNNGRFIKNVTVEAEIESTNGELGGIAGHSNSSIEDAIFEGSVKSTYGNKIGGLAGYQTIPISNIKIKGKISSNGNYTGGIVGENHTNITRAVFNGDLISKGNFVGGIAGYSSGDSTILGTLGNISAEGDYVGGLFGQHFMGIENAYSVVSITNKGNYTGGLIGEMYGSYARNLYFSGEVSGENNVDPIFGKINKYSHSDIENDLNSIIYWNSDLYAGPTNGLGSGKTDAQLKDISTFTGWDFENIWTLEGYLKFK